MGKLWLDQQGRARAERRVNLERREQLDRVYRAYRILQLHARICPQPADSDGVVVRRAARELVGPRG